MRVLETQTRDAQQELKTSSRSHADVSSIRADQSVAEAEAAAMSRETEAAVRLCERVSARLSHVLLR